MKICTVSTIKADPDIVKEFVHYHLNIGIDHMYIFFDDPNDPCIDHFSNYSSVTTTACDSEHWNMLQITSDAPIETRQIANANLALKLARNDNYMWLIHIDADELIYPEVPIKDLLSSLPDDIPVIAFMTLEAIPIHHAYKSVFSEVLYFKVSQTNNFKRFLAYLLGCKNVFKGGFFNGHKDGKAAVRTNADILTIDIHRPKVKGLSSYFIADNAFILHYECCEYNTWYKKWMRRYDGSATAVNMGPARTDQYNLFIDALHKGDTALKHLYSTMYMMPLYKIMILRLLGFVRKVSVNYSMFQKR